MSVDMYKNGRRTTLATIAASSATSTSTPLSVSSEIFRIPSRVVLIHLRKSSKTIIC